MASPQWKKFGFFDKTLVSDPSTPSAPNKAIEGLEITACTSGRGHIIFGDGSGFVHVADRTFQLNTFQAYDNMVTHLKQMRQRDILISIGSDSEGINPVIKVWNMENLQRDRNPVCVRSIKVAYEGKPYPVSCFAVMENLSQLAVGLANGAVLLIRGDISRDRFTKQKIVHKGNHPITGLGFREQAKATYLYVVTSDSVDCYGTQGKENKEELDNQGCELGCAIVSEPDQEMVLGRTEAVYFYGPEGRGACFIFDGNKKLLSWFRNYLVIIGKDNKTPGASSASASSTQLQSRQNSVNIYDLKNKFIGWSGVINDVTHVVSEWGTIFIVTGDKQIFQLEEKDTSTKLDMLFKKHLYPVAINLAHSAQYDYSSVIEIFRKYGDHLYGKGDFDGAMGQYLKTIGKLEPSYVIRKFLDAQRIHNLTSYLQELHEKGLANADHTTLLLNCFTKLKDVKRLDDFLKTDKNLNFDVETAIKVCRQAAYHEHALYLARKFQQHELYLKIQLEDVNDFNDALEYISSLDFYEAEKNMKLYGKTLVNHLPEATTNLLVKLCSDYVPQRAKKSAAAGELLGSGALDAAGADGGAEEPRAMGKVVRSAPEEFIHIFVNRGSWLTRFLELMISIQPDSSEVVYNTLLELYLKGTEGEEGRPESTGDQSGRQKAMDLLRKSDANFDLDHALVLAKMYNFKDAVLFLFEKAKLYKDIVQYYMETDDYPNVILSCKKYGDKDPNVWVQVLSYFAQKDEDCQKEVSEILNMIDKKNLLPPLLVIRILSKSSSITLSVVKEYISRRIQAESHMIVEDHKQIKKYQEEIERMRNEIQELKTSAKIFQLTKCTSCNLQLELPTIHFLCMHSFHQRCLGDNEKECPYCAPQNNAILERRKAFEQSANQHEQFFKQLEGSENGFSVISEYFGRNVFNKVVLLGDKI